MLRRLVIAALILFLVVGVAGYLLLPRLLGSDLVRRSVEVQLSTYLQQPVRVRGAAATLFPRPGLELREVRIGEPAAIELQLVRFETGLRPLLRRRIEEATLLVQKGRVQLPLAFPLPGGGSVGPAVDTSGGISVGSIRAIDLRDVMVRSAAQEWFISATGAVAPGRVTLSDLTIAANATRVYASGIVSHLDAVRGEFTARADMLDVDEVLTFISGAAAPPAPAAGEGPNSRPLNVTVTLTAPVARFAGRAFRNVTTTATLEAGLVRLSDLSLRIFGGTFAGDVEADTTSPGPMLRVSGRLQGIDVAETLQAAGAQAGITGRLGGDLKLSGRAANWSTLLRTAEGVAHAAITDGTMPRLDLVRPVVLAFGRPSGAPPEGSGSAFSRLAGTFTFRDGVVATRDLTMAARDFDVAGEGRLHLVNGDLSARGNIVLSQELTAQAGVDLRRYAQENGRVIVPATVGGTLQSPRVSLDVAAATRRALGNELQRRTKSLLDGLLRKR